MFLSTPDSARADVRYRRKHLVRGSSRPDSSWRWAARPVPDLRHPAVRSRQAL